MEPTNIQKPPVSNQPEKQSVPTYLVAIVITLAVAAVVLGILLYREAHRKQVIYEEKQFVEEQKQNLEGELNNLIMGYDSLKTENDSINGKLEIQQEHIRKLLNTNASNVQKIQMYQKEMETLRKVMRSYIVQIDSLNTRNRELTEENIMVKDTLAQVQGENVKLNESKLELISKVALAQKLSAKNIIALALNDKSKEKDKADKVAKIRVCFTIRENRISDAGKKVIYVRIVRPDKVVLSSPDASMFEYQSQSLVYSAKRDLDYDNQDIDMCIYWDKKEELIKGTYSISLYCEGYEIGTTTLNLF